MQNGSGYFEAVICDKMIRIAYHNDAPIAMPTTDMGDILGVIRHRTKGIYSRDGWDLHRAVVLGHMKTIRHLLMKPRYRKELNVVDENGHTPLMLAVMAGRYDLAETLLEYEQCDVNHLGANNETVLHMEAEKDGSSEEMAALLVKSGAYIEVLNVYGMTPFRKAIEYHNVTFAKYLYSVGCQVDVPCSVQGFTALQAAIQAGHEDTVKWLTGIGCDVNLKNVELQTPIMLCVQQRKDPHMVFIMMKYLIDAGAFLNEQDICGNTALLLAMSNPTGIRKRHIELLLIAGADPNVPNCDGLTPLWQAVYTGTYNFDRTDIIQLLIQENCSLDIACRGKLLFHCGMDSVYCYETCMTPLEVAMDSGLYEAAKMLVLAGCLIKPDMRYEMPVTDTPVELVWFREMFETPPTLQQLSRLAIRQILGQSVQSKVRKLPLPEKIKGFLLLDDVFEEYYASK